MPKPQSPREAPPAHPTATRLLAKSGIKSHEIQAAAILLDPPAAAARFSPSKALETVIGEVTEWPKVPAC